MEVKNRDALLQEKINQVKSHEDVRECIKFFQEQFQPSWLRALEPAARNLAEFNIWHHLYRREPVEGCPFQLEINKRGKEFVATLKEIIYRRREECEGWLTSYPY